MWHHWVVGGLSCSSLLNIDVIADIYICPRCSERRSKYSFIGALALVVIEEVSSYSQPKALQLQQCLGERRNAIGLANTLVESRQPNRQWRSRKTSSRCFGHGMRP